jgi:hypothetical protein
MTNYDKIANDSKKCKEKKDCSVRAITAVSNLPYEYVHEVFAKCGRIHGRGTSMRIIENVLFKLNIWTEKIKTSAKTIRSLKKTLPKKGRFLVHVSGHMLAVVDGEVIDWTKERLHRITAIYEVSF